MRAAILTFGASAVLTLAAASAYAEPTIVLTPASAAPAAPLQSRCALGPQGAGESAVECVVEQKAIPGQASAVPLRILIRTQSAAAAACPARTAQEVAIPAASAPTRPKALPEVVQAAPPLDCAL